MAVQVVVPEMHGCILLKNLFSHCPSLLQQSLHSPSEQSECAFWLHLSPLHTFQAHYSPEAFIFPVWLQSPPKSISSYICNVFLFPLLTQNPSSNFLFPDVPFLSMVLCLCAWYLSPNVWLIKPALFQDLYKIPFFITPSLIAPFVCVQAKLLQ